MPDRHPSSTEWSILELLQEAAALLDEMPDTFDRGRFENGLHALRDQILQTHSGPAVDDGAPCKPNVTG